MNRRFVLVANIFATIVSIACVCVANAAEIRLRAEAKTTATIVRLADIAEIAATSPAHERMLADVEIAAAPAAGEQRRLRAREVQDILQMRGINVAEHRLSGASSVAISAVSTKVATSEAKTMAPNKAELKRATESINKAASQAAKDADVDHTAWIANVSLTHEQKLAVAQVRGRVEIEFPAKPVAGAQPIVIQCQGSKNSVIECGVELSPPDNVLVLTNNVPRGGVIAASDVRSQSGVALKGPVEVFQNLEDVVGKEAARNLAAGQVLDAQTIREPLLVRRGDIVTVFARAAGVRVRTTARAREDGASGSVIAVEAVNDRKAYFARVSGPQEVEVLAQAQSVR